MAMLIADARGFLSALAQDNTKLWWDAHKATYDAQLKAPALALLDRLAPQIAAIVGHAVTPKLWRPHRDVRFSKDKSPYNTHLHMAWHLAAGGRQDPAVFFGVAPDYVTAGVGVFEFLPKVLPDWRRSLDLDAARVGGLLTQAETAGLGFGEPALKRVPAPYPQDHVLGRFLRMKGLAATREIGATSDPDSAILAVLRDAAPVLAVLDGVL
jgi:uncharacterized protein (TIGR02453 family)